MIKALTQELASQQMVCYASPWTFSDSAASTFQSAFQAHFESGSAIERCLSMAIHSCLFGAVPFSNPSAHSASSFVSALPKLRPIPAGQGSLSGASGISKLALAVEDEHPTGAAGLPAAAACEVTHSVPLLRRRPGVTLTGARRRSGSLAGFQIFLAAISASTPDSDDFPRHDLGFSRATETCSDSENRVLQCCTVQTKFMARRVGRGAEMQGS